MKIYFYTTKILYPRLDYLYTKVKPDYRLYIDADNSLCIYFILQNS